jgi:cytochrome c553
VGIQFQEEQNSRMRGLLFTLGLAICARACDVFAADAASTQLDTIAQRALPCTSCHGKEGRAAPDGYYPRIAGKPADYLINQLVNFRDGRRFFPMMIYLTERQTDSYLRELANHFASQQLPYESVSAAGVPAATLARGQRLVNEGDSSMSLPACSACHGGNLLGAQPAVPGLLGVSRSYLDAQLAAWKNGIRHAKPPDCMATIARRLSPSDIEAVTGWLATKEVPGGALPEASVPTPQPIQCGSIP